MSWIQDNKMPAAILGVSGAGVIGLGVVLFNTWSSYSATLENFDNINNGLAILKGATLAPTPENLALKQGVVAEYLSTTDSLARVLDKLQPPVAPISNTDFKAKLSAKTAESRKLATALGMALPVEYNLGFDTYTSELPKSDQVAAELSGYLDAVDEIVNTLAKSGVKSVNLLQRSELASEKDTPAPAPPKRTPTPAGRPGQAARPVAAAPAKITERNQVTISLTCDQAALQLLISRLASPSEVNNFTVVRLLRIENEKQEGPLRSAAAAPVAPQPGSGEPSAAPTTTTAAPPDGGAPATAKPVVAVSVAQPAPEDAVKILGGEMLRVYLEIDLVKFLNTQAAAPATR